MMTLRDELHTMVCSPCALLGFVLVLVFSGSATAEEKRKLDFSDLAAVREVSEARVSPAGEWVAYVVRTSDVEADRIAGDIWMTSWDGARTLQLTFTEASESHPRFSPDGKYLAFLASRGPKEASGKEKDQVWLLERAGGEARKLTDFPGGVSDYAWSPDGTRLAVIASDPDPDEPSTEDAAKEKTPPPIVIDRYQFKQDRVGYLRRLRDHLYLFRLETEEAELLTPGDFDESLPSWSPDGSLIAFFSKREGDPDRNDNRDLYLMEPKAGAMARKLTTFSGDDGMGEPAVFSPDGESIAYLQGSSPDYSFYDQARLAVIPTAGGEPRLLLPDLDRAVSHPEWSADGRSITFLLEDDRNQVVARVAAGGGPVERLAPSRGVVREIDMSAGRVAVVVTTPQSPAEVMALEDGSLRPLSTQNEKLLSQVELGELEGIEFPSRDGTMVHGIMVKPPDYQPGRRYPTVVYIHGGPVAQDGYEFDFIWQILAANGYVVVAPDYRGSSGRGLAFTKAIEADWGNLEVQDVLAAIDHVVAEGVADPDRLGIGGWSYGAMTTNYTIAKDRRFKAAVSGAGISNMLAGYGTDQYVRQYENELALPWENIEPYLHVSFPFFHAANIKTPTLFLCGEKDFNVPLLNSEQMYQALRSLGVETELVIYPGQFHGLTKPSYQRDRLERYVAWFDRFLKNGRSADLTAESGAR